MRATPRRVAVAVTLLALGACGGSDSPTEPGEQDYLDVAGAYRLTGTVDGLGGSGALVGWLTLTQPAGGQLGDLAGSVRIVVHALGIDTGTLDLSDATVSETGAVRFCAAAAVDGAAWCFTGQAGAYHRISGRHSLSDAAERFAGDWMAAPVGDSAPYASAAATIR